MDDHSFVLYIQYVMPMDEGGPMKRGFCKDVFKKGLID